MTAEQQLLRRWLDWALKVPVIGFDFTSNTMRVGDDALDILIALCDDTSAQLAQAAAGRQPDPPEPYRARDDNDWSPCELYV